MPLQVPLTVPDERAIGRHAVLAELHQAGLDRRWCVFGVPVAYDCPRPDGPAGGPASIRGAVPYFDQEAPQLWDFDRGRAVRLSEIAPWDFGNITAPENGSLERILADVEFLAAAITHAGGRPLILGGEHWLSLPVVQALARYHPDGFHVVHFDAHTDRQWPDDPARPLYNGNVMSFVARQDRVRGLVQLGVREFELGHFDSAGPSTRSHTPVYTTRHVMSALDPTALYGTIPSDAKVYLSIDVDVLDPSVAPEVAFPVPDGLQLPTLLAHIQLIMSRYQVIGMDLVELATSSGRLNLGALALSRVLMQVLIGGSSGATESTVRPRSTSPSAIPATERAHSGPQ